MHRPKELLNSDGPELPMSDDVIKLSRVNFQGPNSIVKRRSSTEFDNIFNQDAYNISRTIPAGLVAFLSPLGPLLATPRFHDRFVRNSIVGHSLSCQKRNRELL